uniref:Uncharacterized protein n=1 Tax=Catagonus wagneri TaxID=51154 RepID=A0A8C3VZU0_9CETA
MAPALPITLPSRMSLRPLKWSLLLLSLLSFLVMRCLTLPHLNVHTPEETNLFFLYRIHLDVCQLRCVNAVHGFSSKEINHILFYTFWVFESSGCFNIV